MTNQHFDDANQLWFELGYTRRAIEAYRQAYDLNRNDPVIALQSAIALWAVDEIDESQTLMEAVERNAVRLRPLTRWSFLRDAPKYASLCKSRVPAGFDVWDLDMETLAGRDGVGWFTIASAASQRKMYGLAMNATERCGGSDRDAVEDSRQALIEAETAHAALSQMYDKPELDPGIRKLLADGVHPNDENLDMAALLSEFLFNDPPK